MSIQYWSTVNIMHVNQEFHHYDEFAKKFSFIKETFNLQYTTVSSRFIATDTKVTSKNLKFNPDLKYSELTLLCKGKDDESGTQPCPSIIKLSAARGKYQTLVCSEYSMDHNHSLEYVKPDADLQKKECAIADVMNELAMYLHTASKEDFDLAISFIKNDILGRKTNSMVVSDEANDFVECILDDSTKDRRTDQQDLSNSVQVSNSKVAHSQINDTPLNPVETKKNVAQQSTADGFRGVENEAANEPEVKEKVKKNKKKKKDASETLSVEKVKGIPSMSNDLQQRTAGGFRGFENEAANEPEVKVKVKKNKKKNKDQLDASETLSGEREKGIHSASNDLQQRTSSTSENLIIDNEKNESVELIAFSSLDPLHQLRKILKMLNVPKGVRRAVSIEKFEYLIKETDFHSIPVKCISFSGPGYDLLIERCTTKAKTFMEKAIEEWNAKWKCSVCQKMKSKSNKIIMCDACLLWYHVECIPEKFDEKKAWFCSSCMEASSP